MTDATFVLTHVVVFGAYFAFGTYISRSYAPPHALCCTRCLRPVSDTYSPCRFASWETTPASPRTFASSICVCSRSVGCSARQRLALHPNRFGSRGPRDLYIARLTWVPRWRVFGIRWLFGAWAPTDLLRQQAATDPRLMALRKQERA